MAQPDKAHENLQRNDRCVILGVGVCCAAGSRPAGLFGATAGNITGVARDSGFQVIDVPTNRMRDVMACRVPEAMGETPGERMEELAAAALSEALAHVPAEIRSGAIHISTLLPDRQSPQRQSLDLAALESLMAHQCASAKDVTMHWAGGATGGPRAMAMAMDILRENRADVVLLGGVDSLVDPRTHGTDTDGPPLLASGRANGLAPGEGACWLVLVSEGRHASGALQMGWISGVGGNAVDGGDGATTSADVLVAAIQSALTEADMVAGDIGTVMMTLGAERGHALQWHSVQRRLWPEDAAFDVADGLEVFQLDRAVGWSGVAQWPLAMAAAGHRFSYGNALAKGVLVCDIGPGVSPGAVLLRAGDGGGSTGGAL